MRNNINKNITNQSRPGFFSVAVFIYSLPADFGGGLRRVLSS